MRFDRGWVKMHRKLNTSKIGKDGAACWIFMKLVSWANVQESRVSGEPLLRGQVVTGLNEIADETGFSKPTISRKLKMLENAGMLTRHMKRRGSKITICNYDEYQCTKDDQEDVSETIVKRSRNDSVPILKNKEKRIKKDIIHVDADGIDPIQLVKIWNEHKDQNQPRVDESKFKAGSKRYRAAKSRLKENPNLEYWINVVRKLSASPFCRGETTNWVATFDFLVQTDTHIKVIEGKYDDRTIKPQQQIKYWTPGED